VRAKNVGKKSSQKSAKTRFLYSHEYRDQKMGGNNARNNFSRNTRIVRAKNILKKIVTKKCENTFLYSHEYRVQKIGEKKRAKQYFQKQTNSASKKCWEKNRLEKVRKHIFYIHMNIVTKKWGGGETRETIFPETHE